MISIKKCDAFLLKHHHYISSFVLAIAVIVTLDLVTPTLLLAQSLPSLPSYAAPTVQQSAPAQQQPINNPAPPNLSNNPIPPNQPSNPQPIMPPPGQQPINNPAPINQSSNQQPPMMQQPGGGNNFNTNMPLLPGRPSGGPNGPTEEQMNKQQAERDAQQLKQMKSGLRGMEQGVKMFQKQIDRLTKQNIVIPTEVADTMTKITALISSLKSTDNFQDAQDQMQELPDLMQNLNDQRMTLEKLSRWPQTLKQADRILKQLDKSLAQDQSLSLKLAKNGYDISDLVNKFASGIQLLKDSREKAVGLIKTDPDAAFEEIQTNLFEQTNDLMQSDQTIKELSNLSRFNSSFKSSLNQAQSVIKKLKNLKVDTSELEAQLQQVKDKAAEVTALIGQKPIDTEAIIGVFDDLNSLRQDFENTSQQLMSDAGVNLGLPWESGPQQFKQIDTGSLNKFMPQQSQSPQQNNFGPGGNNPQMSPGTF